jgi:hypothetical protein
VLVNADGARTGVGLGDATDGDDGLRDRVLGEGTHLLEHPLGSAYVLADEDLVGALLPPTRRLEALLLVVAPLDPDRLAGHECRDPSNSHHASTYLFP